MLGLVMLKLEELNPLSLNSKTGASPSDSVCHSQNSDGIKVSKVIDRNLHYEKLFSESWTGPPPKKNS